MFCVFFFLQSHGSLIYFGSKLVLIKMLLRHNEISVLLLFLLLLFFGCCCCWYFIRLLFPSPFHMRALRSFYYSVGWAITGFFSLIFFFLFRVCASICVCIIVFFFFINSPTSLTSFVAFSFLIC